MYLFSFPFFQVRTLFVSGLPMDTKPRELYLLFRAYEVRGAFCLYSKCIHFRFREREAPQVPVFSVAPVSLIRSGEAVQSTNMRPERNSLRHFALLSRYGGSLVVSPTIICCFVDPPQRRGDTKPKYVFLIREHCLQLPF